MSSDPHDDEALTWAGDPEPVETPGSKSRPGADAEPAVAGGWKVVGKPGRIATAPADHRPGQLSSVALVTYGILAGIYLLYTIGWLIAAQRATGAPADIVGGAMFTVGLWFAVLSPAFWIAATFWVTRGSASLRARLLALAVGVLVLAPWPFIVGAN
ncbi:hypothetical protein [Mycetocola sp.]|uniref:hypothetical protein n=1 Tax=Mycetocola sp. TaxID=1871042 RepID=UPI003989B209